MVATSIMSTDAEMLAMAGKNVDATGFTDANKTAWGLQAENFLNILARYNFSDNFAALNIDVKYILSEYVARYVAVAAILYDMSGFTTRLEAEDMVNVHTYRMRAIEKLLIDQKSNTFIQGA